MSLDLMPRVAEGVRCHHPTARSVLGIVVDPRRPYGESIMCSRCGQLHTHKTYHLEIDATGHFTVSVIVLERLKEIAAELHLDPNAIMDDAETRRRPQPLGVIIEAEMPAGGVGPVEMHIGRALEPVQEPDPVTLAVAERHRGTVSERTA